MDNLARVLAEPVERDGGTPVGRLPDVVRSYGDPDEVRGG